MTIALPIELTAKQTHGTATDDVNRFRGRCVECFARIERAMCESLSTISAIGSEFRVSAPHTFGGKVKELRRALSPDSPFANAKLLKALDALQDKLDRRNLIVHAVSEVWIDGSGKWLWLLKFRSGKGATDQSESLEREAARQFEQELASSSRSFCDRLRSWQMTFSVPE